MTYLYLLPFKDGVHFKLGISKNLDIRVKNHANNFDLDLDNSLIVSAKKSVFITSLEQELLLKLDKTDFTSFCDGYTEIRYMQDFEKALGYIKSKDDVLGFKIEKYNIIIKPKLNKEGVVVDRKHIKYMSRIVGIRKQLNLTQNDISNWLNIALDEYEKIEKIGCESGIKKKILMLLIIECSCDWLKDELNNMLTNC